MVDLNNNTYFSDDENVTNYQYENLYLPIYKIGTETLDIPYIHVAEMGKVGAMQGELITKLRTNILIIELLNLTVVFGAISFITCKKRLN
ncbi:MAG: hypothetical protein JJE53_03720 [Candidatus Pacebacteria bacterium]|nr:hypothetical protein [Candidatus Paceibacterota bacterium]